MENSFGVSFVKTEQKNYSTEKFNDDSVSESVKSEPLEDQNEINLVPNSTFLSHKSEIFVKTEPNDSNFEYLSKYEDLPYQDDFDCFKDLKNEKMGNPLDMCSVEIDEANISNIKIELSPEITNEVLRPALHLAELDQKPQINNHKSILKNLLLCEAPINCQMSKNEVDNNCHESNNVSITYQMSSEWSQMSNKVSKNCPKSNSVSKGCHKSNCVSIDSERLTSVSKTCQMSSEESQMSKEVSKNCQISNSASNTCQIEKSLSLTDEMSKSELSNVIIDTNMDDMDINNPHVCDFCHKTFPYKSFLDRHRIVHTGQRSFQCEICQKSFTNSSNLNRHRLAHSKEKLFVCDICNRSFNYNSTLKEHKLTHTDDKAFYCEICKKSFSYKQSLVQHMLIHSGNKPYSCNICSKSFVKKFVLQVHLKTHSTIKTYKCPICFKDFNLKTKLVKHRKECPK